MVEAKGVKETVSVGELAVRLEKRRVPGDSLIQQIGRLKQFGSRDAAKICQKKILGAGVKIESGEIDRRRTLDFAFFALRKLRLSLIGNRLCDLTLNREYIREIAIVSFSPEMPVSARINQLRVDAHAIANALYASFHHMCHAELLADLVQIPRHSALVLHRRGAADHF